MKRPCLEPGCPNVIEAGSKYRGRCKEHHLQRERERMARRRADPDKGKRLKVYHSKKWLMTRKRVLSSNPMCENCGERLASEVDHRIPLSQGGDPYALTNCSPLCGPCHWRKTARENAARGGLNHAA
jgi:5-methylcytosine-specific restriction enzyme A